MTSSPIAPTGEHADAICEHLGRIADAIERMDQRQSEVDAASDAHPCCAEALALLTTARKLLRQVYNDPHAGLRGFEAHDQWGVEVMELAPKIGAFMKEHA